MEYRKFNRWKDDVALLAVGEKVAVKFFDPNGPGAIDRMSTMEGTVTKIVGDPVDGMERTVWVRGTVINGRECPWYDQVHLDYFGGDLWVPVVGDGNGA